MVTMSAVWDRTSEFLDDQRGAIIAIAVPTLYLPSVAQNILQPVMAAAEPGAKLGWSLLSLALSLVSVLGQAALIALALEPTAGRNGAFARGLRRFPVLIGISLLLLIGLILLGLPLIFILVAGGVDMTALANGSPPDIAPGAAGLILLYLVVLAPVLLWLAARLSVVAPVVVGEQAGLGAFGRSFRLTRGLALKIVGVLILFVIVASVASLAAKTVLGSVFRLALGGDGIVTAAGVLTALLVALVTAGFSAVLTLFFAKLYVAARDRAETASA